VRAGRRRGSIGAQRALGRSRASPDEVDAAVIALVERVCGRMRAADRAGRTVVLRLRFDDYARITRSHTFPCATAQTDAILTATRMLMAATRPEIERRGLTLVGIAVANLENADAMQLSLPLDGHDRDALDAVLDDVRGRYGPRAIVRAVLLGRDGRPPPPLLPD
jgi:DNA polymerase IV